MVATVETCERLTADASTIAAYLRWVHARAAHLPARVVVTRTTADPEIGRYRSRSFRLDDLDAAGGWLSASSDAGHNVFARVHLVDAPLDGEGGGRESMRRGGADATRWVTHFAADVDVAGVGHASTNLAPTVEAAVGMIDATLAPSLIVGSGGGLYPVWRLAEPVDVADDAVRARVQRIGRRIDHALRSSGWAVDATAHDLARHLRPPGAINLKPGRDPRPVTVLRGHLDGAGDYTLDGLDAALPPLPPPPPKPAARWRDDDTATPWAILAERYSVDDILATDPVHRWERVADVHLDGSSRPAWRRVGSSADYSIKLGDDALIVWSASFAAELGVDPGAGVTPYQLLRHFAGGAR